MGRPLDLTTSDVSRQSRPNAEMQMAIRSSRHNNESQIGTKLDQSSASTEVTIPSLSNSITGSEPSGPSSLSRGAIHNFGEVSPGIYRSSIPRPCNIEHLDSLKLKTLITLVTTPFEPEFEHWLASNAIECYRIDITSHKTRDDRIPLEAVASVMRLLADETKRPLLMHCNKGRHRTGCMAAAFCKLRGIEEERIVGDYREYARPKVRELDVAFIRRLRREDVWEAMAGLERPIAPEVCHFRPSDGSMSIGSVEGSMRDVLTTAEGSCITRHSEDGDHMQERISVGRVLMGPDPLLSPPLWVGCKESSFSVDELVDALCKVREGHRRRLLTPPSTPPHQAAVLATVTD